MAAIERRYKIIVEISTNSVISPKIIYVKNDNSNFIEFEFRNGSTVIDASGKTATISIQRPDNTEGTYNDITIEDGNFIWEAPPSSVNQAGKFTGTMQVYENGRRYTTLYFKYTVVDTLVDDGLIVENEQYPVLTNLITSTQNLYNNLTNALNDAASATSNANSKATYAQSQGDYSKTQGDYSKAQGDYAKAKGDSISDFNIWEMYNPTKSYVPLNKVSYLGSSYICIANSQGITPDSDLNKWNLIASKGNDGLSSMMFATFTATVNNTSHIPHNLLYNPTKDYLQVIDSTYSCLLDKDVNYTENADNISIDLLGWSIASGEKIKFILFKNIK